MSVKKLDDLGNTSQCLKTVGVLRNVPREEERIYNISVDYRMIFKRLPLRGDNDLN